MPIFIELDTKANSDDLAIIISGVNMMAKNQMAFAEFIIDDPDAWKNAGKPQVDPAQEFRTKVVAYIDAALGHVEAGEDNPARGAYKTKGELSQVTIKAGRQTVALGGKERNVVPRDKLQAFLEAVKDAAIAGQLDDAVTSTVTRSIKSKSESDPRYIDDKRAKPWSEERKAAHAARLKESWAKRNAEKAAAAKAPAKK